MGRVLSATVRPCNLPALVEISQRGSNLWIESPDRIPKGPGDPACMEGVSPGNLPALVKILKTSNAKKGTPRARGTGDPLRQIC